MLHTHFRVQVKLYSRVNGQRDKNDRGYVSISYNKWATGSYNRSDQFTHFYRLSLLCTFVFLNILTPIVLAKLVSLHYPKMSPKASMGDFVRYLYWAAAGTAFLVNIGYTSTSLSRQYNNNHPTITSCIIQLSDYPCSIPSDTSVYNDEVLTLVAKFIIIPIAVFMELLISVYTVKNNYDIQQKFIGYRCSSLKHYLLLSVLVFALWNILTTLQLFAMTIIPVFMLLLTHPQVTITSIMFLLLIPFGFTLVVACILYQCQKLRRNFQSNARCCGSMCLYFVVIITTIGLILTLLALYEVMLLVQVQIETGVKGIVLSLLPSIPLSALGWYVKRRSQRRSKTDSDEMLQLTPEECSSCTIEMTNSEDSLPLPL